MTRPSFKLTAGIVLALLAAAAPFYLSGYNLSLTGRFLALSLTAMGLVIIWGEGGVLSLGQGVFFGLGGYVLAMHLKLMALDPGEAMPDFMVWTNVKALPWFWAMLKNPLIALLGVVVVPGIVAAAFGWLVLSRVARSSLPKRDCIRSVEPRKARMTMSSVTQ